LADNIVVSFEQESVTLVYASVSGNALTVQKNISMPPSDFSDFLKRERASSFSVVADFPDAAQFTMLLPNLKDIKGKVVHNIIAAEIKKRFPALEKSAFIWHVIGSNAHDGKTMQEIFVYAVREDTLTPITNIFAQCDKTISCLVPGFIALSRLVPDVETLGDRPVLVVAGGSDTKTLMLMKGSALHFVRRIDSSRSGYSPYDIQSINMTINYCRQTLRMNPAKVLFIGLAPSAEQVKEVIVSAELLEKPLSRVEGMDTIPITPVAVLLHAKALMGQSLLPKAYAGYVSTMKMVKASALIFILLACAAIGATVFSAAELFSAQSRLDNAKAAVHRVQSRMDGFAREQAVLERYKTAADFLDTNRPSPALSTLLARLSEVASEELKNLSIQSISAASEGSAITLTLKASAAHERYNDMQKDFDLLKKRLLGTPGTSLTGEKTDLKARSIELRVLFQPDAPK